ncbi:protein white-like [Palaemon carinicauda]|uniref:protein white-like n=1 Tax=Palaemon carinicauda TaxID=392227 RepID=UPI0035B697BF
MAKASVLPLPRVGVKEYWIILVNNICVPDKIVVIEVMYNNEMVMAGLVIQDVETSVPIEASVKGKERLTYSWENLNVYATVRQGYGRRSRPTTKHILKNVTGVCRPGELLAIMGASGAGKTTLLNCLTFRSDQALKIKGKLYVNGQRVTPNLLTSRSAYVQQEDLFVGTLTVKEQLTFQANLRMDSGVSDRDRNARVEEVMVDLNLVKCANTLIGCPGVIKGISGGEMKRLAFACEVVTDPPLMFCDEPTTGLDSFMAQNIVEVMRSLTQKGKTIISTIHQPSSEVFALFDRVLLMAEGRTAFLGSTENALHFFNGMGKVCPDNYNPADFFVGNLAIVPENENDCRDFVGSVCDAFEKSSWGQDISEVAASNSKASAGSEGLKDLENTVEVAKSPYKVGWWSQFTPVLGRAIKENLRSKMVIRANLLQAIVIGILIGLIYLDQEMDQDGIQNMNGAMYIMITQTSTKSLFSVVNAFCGQLPIFLREHFNGMYRTDVYFVAKNIAEFPMTIVVPTVLISIAYFMIGLNPLAKKFFIALAVLIFVCNTATSFGVMLSCLAPNPKVALGLGSFLLIPFMVFGGFLLNSDSVPIYFIWIKYLSWFNYANEALIVNQWAGVYNISCPDESVTCLYDGESIIESLGYEEGTIGFNIGILFVLMIGLRLVAFLFLLNRTTRKSVKSYE